MADEVTLLIIRECFVYRIPPRSTSKGHKAADWDVNGYLWTGRLRIVAVGEQAILKLEDAKTGELFAMCRYDSNANTVEPVTDSSRYFVIKVENERGQHSFIGLGFQERTTAFDFNVCLQDHVKHLEMEKEAEKRKEEYEKQPKRDYSLGAGQSIHITIPGGAKPKTQQPAAVTSSSSGGSFGILPPPPSKGQPQQARPPVQPQQPQPTQQQSGQLVDWGDFNDFTAASSGQSGWTSFN